MSIWFTIQFVDDIKIGDIANTIETSIGIQEDPDAGQNNEINKIIFYKKKYIIFHFGKKNQRHDCKMGKTILDRITASR